MSLIPLSLESLKDLDAGKVSVAWQHELRRLIDDCRDRPGDVNVRELTLSLRLKPVVAQDGDCEGARGVFQVKSKVPMRKTKAYDFGINRKGHCYFSEMSPDAVDQPTFDDVDPATGKVVRKMQGDDA